MSESPQSSETNKKKGFWSRIMDRVDKSLKAKADAKTEQGCCGGGDKGKGGSCC